MNIKQLIGESTEYDKKERLEEKEPRSWLKSVSAFANGIGGTLIFGIVDKTGEVVGVRDPDGDAEKISRCIRDRIDPIPPLVNPVIISAIISILKAIAKVETIPKAIKGMPRGI